jgi:hypothetical protein
VPIKVLKRHLIYTYVNLWQTTDHHILVSQRAIMWQNGNYLSTERSMRSSWSDHVAFQNRPRAGSKHVVWINFMSPYSTDNMMSKFLEWLRITLLICDTVVLARSDICVHLVKLRGIWRAFEHSCANRDRAYDKHLVIRTADLVRAKLATANTL